MASLERVRRARLVSTSRPERSCQPACAPHPRRCLIFARRAVSTRARPARHPPAGTPSRPRGSRTPDAQHRARTQCHGSCSSPQPGQTRCTALRALCDRCVPPSGSTRPPPRTIRHLQGACPTIRSSDNSSASPQRATEITTSALAFHPKMHTTASTVRLLSPRHLYPPVLHRGGAATRTGSGPFSISPSSERLALRAGRGALSLSERQRHR